MKSRIIFLLATLFCYTSNFAQNLVKNPGLEEYHHLPDLQYQFGDRYRDSTFICKYWHKVKETTPDYFHINAKNERYTIPYNNLISGYHPVLTDSAYIGFVPFCLSGGAEPVSGESTEPLRAEKLYEISFSYCFAGASSYFYLDKIECIISPNIDKLKYNQQGFTDYERIKKI